MKLVKCVDARLSEDFLKKNKFYIIKKELEEGYDLKGVVLIFSKGWAKKRFVTVKCNEKIIRLLYDI